MLNRRALQRRIEVQLRARYLRGVRGDGPVPFHLLLGTQPERNRFSGNRGGWQLRALRLGPEFRVGSFWQRNGNSSRWRPMRLCHKTCHEMMASFDEAPFFCRFASRPVRGHISGQCMPILRVIARYEQTRLQTFYPNSMYRNT